MQKKQKGQSIVEFALVLPLFLLLVFGLLYVGMLLADYLMLSSIARSSAREAAIISSEEYYNNNYEKVRQNYKDKKLPMDIFTWQADSKENFYSYDFNAIVHLNENKVYKELLKEGKELVNKFANGFFIEVSKGEIDTDIKYVTFSNYRKKEYRMMTIIDSTNVKKKIADKDAISHIKSISENLKELKKYDIKLIENIENNVVSSKFINSKRFDIELSKSTTVDEFYENFKILKNIIDKDSISYEELKKEDTKISDTIINYDEEKLNKLHFLRKAFIDLVPKNMFLIDNILNVFDQEWVEENLPTEYIYYRSILNTSYCFESYSMEDLFKRFGILEYIDLFENLEKDLRDKTFDYDAYYIFFREYLGLKQAQDEREFYLEKSNKLEAENKGLNLELEDAREQIVDYANQLRVISNSTSWKIIQFFRKIFRKIFKRK